MDNDPIEEFLRRVTQKRVERQKPPEDVVEILEPEEIIEATAVVGNDRAVPRVGSQADFAERAGHLGEEVGLADEKLTAHLHERFDRQLGSLQQSEAETPGQAESKSTGSEETRAMALRKALHTSAGIRQSVLLAEILNPAHLRW